MIGTHDLSQLALGIDDDSDAKLHMGMDALAGARN